MVIKTYGKKGIFLTLLTLIMAGTLIAAGCSGGGGSTSSLTGDTGADTGGSTAAKATLSGTLVSSSSSSGSSLFKRLGKAAAATSSSLPVSGATVLCFDTDSVSTAAAGSDTTDSSGNWIIEDLDAGNYVCFGVYIDIASLTLKTTRMDDIAAEAGQTTTIATATVESDTTSPTIVSVLSDNVSDTSLSDGDPDPLYELSDILPTQAISVIFTEAMNTSAMQPGTGVVLRDSSGTTVSMTVAFNGTGTEFRYTPVTALTTGSTYTLYITNKAKDLANNGINDPDSDGYVALARITVAEQVDPFAYLSSSPKDGDTGMSVYKDLTVTFNRPVDFVSFKDNTTISPALSGRLEPSGDGVTLFHSTPLAASTAYTVTIGANVADLAGNKLGTPVTFTFTTGAGVDNSTVAGFAEGGGTTDDLLAIVAGINKAMLTLDNQDLVTFASFFATTFTITERECFFDPQARVDASGNYIGEDVCTTSTLNLSDFLDEMKEDISEQRNMAKGFGEVQRLMLTGATGSRMSVEHFNSDFDTNGNPVGTDLYVGWPNRIPGMDFVNTEITVPERGGGTRREWLTYRLDPNRDLDPNTPGPCRDIQQSDIDANGNVVLGAGQIQATYNYWNPEIQRDEQKTQICPVIDGDADTTNSWASDNEVYPSTWNGPTNVWEDNDGDCASGQPNCQNEDGIIVLKNTDSDPDPEQALRYYETIDLTTGNHSAVQEDITAALNAAGGLTVAAAMQVAASNRWDIEAVDNDGDSQLIPFNPSNPSQGYFIERRTNEDWPNGMDDDGDGKIDEDHDGMGSDPWPQDIDSDVTNDPMPHSDWNLANKDRIISNDEFWAQTFLVTVVLSGAAQWRDDAGNVYYEIQGPRGWPYPYAAGEDGRPWSGDEFDRYNDGTGTGIDGHIFAWADVSILGRVYFRNDDKSGNTFLDEDRGVYLDLTAAGFNIVNGVITNPSERVDSSEKCAVIFRWNGSGNLSNYSGTGCSITNRRTIDWQYVRPLMDNIDYNADGDWNVTTNSTSGLRRVPHDDATGGIMSTADYLALGWETWQVSYDYQLISDTSIVWDVEADWARMEGDDDGDGQFNEDGLYSDYFNSDGSLKTCASSVDYPCMTQDAATGVLTLHREDGTTTTSFDISDGLDNDFDDLVDEVDQWDDDGDGNMDEDPDGDPNDLNANGNTTEPYDDDGDGRKDEDPVSYERDRLNDHSQWTQVFQETTDAVVDIFYLELDTDLNVVDLVIDDETGTKATAIVDLIETETWIPHNPWGEDFDRDGVPDDVNTWTETMVFNLGKFGSKWLMTGIQSVDSLQDYAQQVATGDIRQFGGNIARIEMVSPVGDPMSGPATNTGTTPTFKWDDSAVTGTIGSYLIHIEKITEAMVTGGGEPDTVMMLLLAPTEVSTDSAGIRSFTLGSGGTDITDEIIAAMVNDPYFPFSQVMTALADGEAYSWGILAFSQTPSEMATLFASGTEGKGPEPIADSFEPMMFATGALPSYFTQTDSKFATGGTATTSSSTTLQKARIGGVEYNTIPSNIAPSFYDRPSNSHKSYGPSSVDPRSHR